MQAAFAADWTAGGPVWSFVWLWTSYGLFYGAAGIIGGSIR